MLRAHFVTRAKANEIVAQLHRHHAPALGDVFRVGCFDDDGVCHGVVQVGRPVARRLDDGDTCEVIRLATDGHRNACTFLYSRAARIAREMGFARIITYILESEPGVSLRAAGWQCDGVCGGGSWSVPSRPREDKAPTCKKQRWHKEL
jgi:hypothetical protein